MRRLGSVLWWWWDDPWESKVHAGVQLSVWIKRIGVLSHLSFSDLVGHSLPPCCREANGSISVSTRSSSCMRLIPSSWLHSCLLSLFPSRFSWTILWLAPVLYLGICWSRVPLPFRLYLLYGQEWGSLWGRYKAEGENVCLRDQPVYIPIRP